MLAVAKTSVSQSFTWTWEQLDLIPKWNQLTDLSTVPSSCHKKKKRHGCPCKLPQCFSSVNVIYTWSSLTWWLIYTQEKFRNGLADQCFVLTSLLFSTSIATKRKSVGKINYINFSAIFLGWKSNTGPRLYLIILLIGKFSPPLHWSKVAHQNIPLGFRKVHLILHQNLCFTAQS